MTALVSAGQIDAPVPPLSLWTDEMWSKIRILSLWEPWASLMALDEKRIETRGWSTRFRGLVAIAATKSIPASDRQACRDFLQRDPFNKVLRYHGVHFGASPLGCGQIMCVVELVNCVASEDCWDPSDFDCDGTKPEPILAEIGGVAVARYFGNYDAGRFGLVTRGVQRLRRPMQVRGSQGLRPLAADVGKRLREYLEAA